MNIVKILGVADIQSITEKIMYRQEKFPGEQPHMSIGVVLMNYGDSLVQVECTQREWSGTKSQLTPRNGIPLCPNGHPLFELTRAPVIALVEED